MGMKGSLTFMLQLVCLLQLFTVHTSYPDVFRLGSGAWHCLASFVVSIPAYGKTLFPTSIHLSLDLIVTSGTYGLLFLTGLFITVHHGFFLNAREWQLSILH